MDIIGRFFSKFGIAIAQSNLISEISPLPNLGNDNKAFFNFKIM